MAARLSFAHPSIGRRSARNAEPTPGHQRFLGFIAVAALLAATAVAFGRVFTGRSPTLLLLAAALASVAIAALCERRGLLLATLVSLVGLMLAITWIVVPQTAWYGLPSVRTLRAIGRSLELVGSQARERTAPTPALPPLMLATVTAVWTASFSVHALAVRAGSPLLATLPAIALAGFADTVLEDGARPVYAVLLLGGALAMVFADGMRRMQQWGPVWSVGHPRRPRASPRGPRAIAALVLVSAVLVPGLLPGFRAEPLVDLSTSAGNGLQEDPFVAVLGQLDDQEPIDLFVVRSPRATNSRLIAFDTFDGVRWTNGGPVDPDEQVRLTPPTTLPKPPGYPVPPTAQFDQDYRIVEDSYLPWLPMADLPEQVSGPLGEMTWDPQGFEMLIEDRLAAGLEYTVRSRLVIPTSAELDAMLSIVNRPWLDRYREVPASVGPEVLEIARRWTVGEPNTYRRVLAIQQELRTGNYSRDPGLPQDASWLNAFLTEDRTGFCVQFASAMAMLVRALGIPARVVEGYQAGELIDDQTYMVRTDDAHLWVEVYFEGYGWLPFEPTPGRGVNPATQTSTYLNPSEPLDVGPGVDPGQEVFPRPGESILCTEGSLADGPRSGDACTAERELGHGGTFAPSELLEPPMEQGSPDPYLVAVVAGLLVLAALALGIPVVKAVSRRGRLRRAREPREHVLAAYRLFDGEATDLGMGRREGETLEEHRARLIASVAFSDGHLGRLTVAAVRAAYSPTAPTVEEARVSEEDARRAIRDLRRDAGLKQRIVGAYRLRP